MMKSPLIYRATGLEAYLIDPKEVQKLAPILKTSDIEVKLHYHDNYCPVFDDKKEIKSYFSLIVLFFTNNIIFH